MSNIPVNPAAAPHKEPTDAEEVYFEGSPPLRGLGLGIVKWPLIAAVWISMPVFMHRFVTSDVSAWVWVACIGFGLLTLLMPWIKLKSIRYRITNYRIDFERGLFSKNIDTLELWHVEDLCFHQSLIGRILGVGSITVISHDERMPKLFISVPHPRPLYETLKQQVIAVKRARGVIKVDPG
jgi:Bacterial PH domain